jgi:hypothetical protein
VPFGYPIDVIDRGVDALAAAWSQVSRHPVPVDSEELAQVV